MRPRAFFVTGTDTGVGKTQVTAAMMVAAASRGWRTLGLKPIASGSSPGMAGLRNEDACLLQSLATVPISYGQVNPVALEPAIAPHIALGEAGLEFDAAALHRLCGPALQIEHDLMLVEGAGGWRVPLSRMQTLADFARLLGFPVILVVGVRLGCINHALLSAEAIRRDGLPLAAWVANQVCAEVSRPQQIVQSLESMLDAPCLGKIPFLESADPRILATMLDLDSLQFDR